VTDRAHRSPGRQRADLRDRRRLRDRVHHRGLRSAVVLRGLETRERDRSDQGDGASVVAEPGDAGSLVFDQALGVAEGTHPAVGLLFAGTTSARGRGEATIIGACAIDSVLQELATQERGPVAWPRSSLTPGSSLIYLRAPGSIAGC